MQTPQEIFQKAIDLYEIFDFCESGDAQDDKGKQVSWYSNKASRLSAWSCVKVALLQSDIYIERRVYRIITNSIFEIKSRDQAINFFRFCMKKSWMIK